MANEEEGTPVLFYAIADFHSDEPGDLSFKAKQIIAVTDQGEGVESWWYGELEGVEGSFPGTYVRPLKQAVAAKKSFTPPEEQPLDAPVIEAPEPLEAEEPPVQAEAPLQQEGQSSIKAEPRRVSFNLERNTVHETLSPLEYERQGEFDPEASHAQWEKEEDVERMRMLEDRWSVFESNLAPGTKCQERLDFEEAQAERQRKIAEAQAAEADRREERRQRLKQAREERRAMHEAQERVGAVSAPAPAPLELTPTPTANGEGETRAERLRRLAAARAAKRGEESNGNGTSSPAAAGSPLVEEESRGERLRRLAAARAAKKDGNGAQEEARPANSGSGSPAPEGESRAERLRRLAEARAAARDTEEDTEAPTAATVGTSVVPPQREPPSVPESAHSSGPVAVAAARQAAKAPESSESITQEAAKAAQLPPVVTSPEQGAGAEEEEESPLEKAIASLEATIAELGDVDERGGTGFHREFLVLDREDRARFKSEPTAAGRRHEDHNRYGDIVPYDNTRVVLGYPGEVDENDDYINASHMNGLLPGSPNFICAQGPNENSIGHFWKMVAQQRVRVIVMVTNLVEKGREKCEQYWPDLNQSKSFGRNGAGSAVQVFCKEENKSQGWVKRIFKLVHKDGDGTRHTYDVTQLHLVSWPDRGVPATTGGFLTFLHTAMAAQNKAHGEAKKAGEEKYPPLVVHCSAGVGRTGVFCLVYAVLTYLPYVNKGGKYTLDIYNTVRRMRKYRRYLVQTEEQYRFCYTTILSAARYYRDGTKQLKQKKQQQQVPSPAVQQPAATQPEVKPVLDLSAEGVPRASTQPTPPPPSTSVAASANAWPVWLHSCAPSKAEELLREDGLGPDFEGRFLVYTGRDGISYTLCHIHEGKIMHVPMPTSGGQVRYGDTPVLGCANYIELVDRLRQPRDAAFYAPGVLLHDYVPREDCTPEELRREDDKSQSFWRKTELARRASSDPRAGEPAPSVIRDASRTSVTSATSSGGEPDGRRRGALSRFSNSLRKKIGGKKDKKSLSAVVDDETESASITSTPSIAAVSPPQKTPSQERMARMQLPGQAVTGSDVRERGDVLQLSGRAAYLTFLNGVYIELEQGVHSRSVYRRLHPVERSHGHLAGQHVFLYFEPNDRAWVLFLSSTGPIACLSTTEADPASATGVWAVVNTQNELIPDAAVRLTRLPGLPSEDEAAALAHSGQTEVTRLRERLKQAEARERALQGTLDAQKGMGTALAESQERERELVLKLLELREAVAERLGNDADPAMAADVQKLVTPTRAAHAELKRAQELIAQLEASLAEAAVVEQSLRSRLSEVSLSEERLARRVERLERMLDERIVELQAANERETSVAHELAEMKVEYAESHSASDSARSSRSPSSGSFRPPPITSVASNVHAASTDDRDSSQASADNKRAVEEARAKAFGALYQFATESGLMPAQESEPEELEERIAMTAYEAEDDDELSFDQGTIIELVSEEDGWCVGYVDGKKGRFPDYCIGPPL